MYYICYKLSKWGWNTLPTSRNTRGIDIVIYNHDASKRYTIQVKSLSKINPIPLGNSLDHLFADFLIIYINYEQSPMVYVLHMKDLHINEVNEIIYRRIKDNKNSYWLPIKHYNKFKDNWSIIGNGFEQNGIS